MTRLAPGDVIDRYRVERVLASGGFGTVLEARHVHLRSRHALKVLHVEGAEARERLLREGRIQATVRHPGIVAVTDVVPTDDGLVTVMAYVDGTDLLTWARRHPPSPEEVDRIAEALFAAMAYAHAAGVVHRDLKPANVLVERHGDDLAFRVADFGLAVMIDHERLTVDGRGLGTPGYMAPEQLRDAAHADARADVFSLGALLYELLADRPAIRPVGFVDAWQAWTDGKVDPIEVVAPHVPPRMAVAIGRALQVDRADRPASVGALRELWRDGTAPPGFAWSEAALQAAAPRPPLAATAALSSATGPRTWRVAAAVLAAVGVSGSTAILGVWAWIGGGDPPPAPPPAGVGVEAARVATPTEAAPPAPREPAAIEGAAVATVAPRAAEATPARPRRPAAAMASVVVEGVRRARLVDARGQGTAAPASVPAGRYSLEVWFDERGATRVLDFEIQSGQQRTIVCDALRVCE